MARTASSLRMVSAFTISVLTALILAACGGGGGTTTSEAPTSAPAAATSAPAAATEAPAAATSAPAAATEAPAAATEAPAAATEAATSASGSATSASGSATEAATSASGSATSASGSATSATEAATSTSGSATSATAAGGGKPTCESGQLTIAGSSALLPLIQEAAKRYQAECSGAQITVTAGGSGAGRTQVCEGKINIGNSDVKLKDDEKTKLNCADAVETAVAVQAFAPVANKQGLGSVTNLTKDQLVGIFSGQVTNWKDVGGDDQEIVLINRAKGSGTRSQMAKFLFGGDDAKFATGASEEDNSETVRQTVAQTPGAISYLSFAYLQNNDLAALSIDGVAPNKEDIQSGKWPIGGPGYSITKGEPTGLAKAFIAYVVSPDFQDSDAFSTLGFVPLPKS